MAHLKHVIKINTRAKAKWPNGLQIANQLCSAPGESERERERDEERESQRKKDCKGDIDWGLVSFILLLA